MKTDLQEETSRRCGESSVTWSPFEDTSGCVASSLLAGGVERGTFGVKRTMAEDLFLPSLLLDREDGACLSPPFFATCRDRRVAVTLTRSRRVLRRICMKTVFRRDGVLEANGGPLPCKLSLAWHPLHRDFEWIRITHRCCCFAKARRKCRIAPMQYDHGWSRACTRQESA